MAVVCRPRAAPTPIILLGKAQGEHSRVSPPTVLALVPKSATADLGAFAPTEIALCSEQRQAVLPFSGQRPQVFTP